MKNRMIRIFLVTVLLLLCGMIDGGAPFTIEHAAAKDDALSRAQSYIKSQSFSRDGLVDQLEYEGFTKEEAEYGADNCGADWNEMAIKKAKSYIKTSGFSRDGLIHQLEYEGFTKEEAEYGADNCEADWNEMALKKAESYMNVKNYSKKELRHQLEYEGFTDEQIDYALDALSFTAAPEPVTDTNVVSDQMIEVMTKNLENIFVIRGLEEPFNTPMAAQYSDVGNATVVETSNQDGMRNISLYANADNVHDYSSVTKLNAGNLQNFYYEMEVKVNDVYPAGSGGCFIGYTNESTSAVQTEEVKTIGLLVDGDNAEFYIKGKEADSGEHIQITDSKDDTYTVVLIRFTGQTFAYVNGRYAGQYHDDLSGPFQLVYGSTVFSDGDNALCSFDNLIIRKVTN